MGSASPPPLSIAIIGGGITGLCLALGLERRNIPYTLYERSPSFREIGAGVGFSPNAETAMSLLHADIHSAFKRVANPNGEDYFQWIDGQESGELIYKLYCGADKFQGCRRADFVEEMVGMIPPERVRLGREVDEIIDHDGEGEGETEVVFKDGERVRADIVIGCDGIRSRVRTSLLGASNPASSPSYTHSFAFRSLIPTSLASSIIDPYLCSTRFMYNGEGGHIITYPVANGTLLNALFVITDYTDWPHPSKLTARTSKQEAVDFFAKWKHPAVKALVDLLPDVLDKWALFDMMKLPAEKYNHGVVCLAGDAAHAAGPHLGGGAGFGIEDALCLVTALEVVAEKCAAAGVESMEDRRELCEKALEAYNEVRYERTQWLIKATREACALFHLTPPEVPLPAHNEMFGREISERFHTIWEYDVEGMVKRTRELLSRL